MRSSVLPLLSLGLFLSILISGPRPVTAVSLAKCEAWLCLSTGFSVSECSPAHRAVLRRQRLHLDPLPAWASWTAVASTAEATALTPPDPSQAVPQTKGVQ